MNSNQISEELAASNRRIERQRERAANNPNANPATLQRLLNTNADLRGQLSAASAQELRAGQLRFTNELQQLSSIRRAIVLIERIEPNDLPAAYAEFYMRLVIANSPVRTLGDLVRSCPTKAHLQLITFSYFQLLSAHYKKKNRNN